MALSTRAALLGGLLALCNLPATAQEGAPVSVADAYARAVPPGQPNSAVFLTLTNQSSESRALVAARSPAAETVELHHHVHEDGMMRMRRVARIEVPAQESVRLQPGGFHIMLIGLKANLAPGDQVDLTLTFDDDTETRILAPVQKIEPMPMSR